MKRATTTSLVFFLALTTTLAAQTKQPPGFADYGQWETLSAAGSRGGFSPDGQWIAYAINRTNRDNELRITKLADGVTEVIAFGAQPAYSSDSRWIAFRIGQSEAEQEKLRSKDKPVQNQLGLRNLETGETWTVDGIDSFTFSPDGAYLVMRRYAPERPRGSSGGGQAGTDEGSLGTTIILRQLATGRDMTFGNVSQFAWQKVENSHLLAMVISAEDKIGNAVHLFGFTGILCGGTMLLISRCSAPRTTMARRARRMSFLLGPTSAEMRTCAPMIRQRIPPSRRG